jgi:hypothetical protein
MSGLEFVPRRGAEEARNRLPELIGCGRGAGDAAALVAHDRDLSRRAALRIIS